MAIPQFRFAGPVNFIRLPFAGTYAINTGDLCYWDGTSVWPFAHLAAGGSEAADQLSVGLTFAGFAKDTRTVLDTQAESTFPITIEGEVEMDCVSQTWAIGDLVGSSRNGGAALVSQVVTKVTQPSLAFGKVTQAQSVATTRVLFAYKSQVLPAQFNTNGYLAYSTTGNVTGFTAGSSTGVKVDSVFTGNLGTTAYTISDVINMLKQRGDLVQ